MEINSRNVIHLKILGYSRKLKLNLIYRVSQNQNKKFCFKEFSKTKIKIIFRKIKMLKVIQILKNNLL